MLPLSSIVSLRDRDIMARNLKSTLEAASWSDVYRWSAWIIAVGVGILTTLFFAYALFMKDLDFVADPEAWGVFGDFIGGTANPILAFLTIVLLAITIILQAKQLETSSQELRLSRQELELSRTELRRSAEAHEHSEKALKAQAAAAEATAKLAAINALLDYYDAEINRHRDRNYPAADPRAMELSGLKRRRSILKQRLEHFYVLITGDENEQ